MAMGSIVCPVCGSENVQRYSVVYQSGVSNVTSNSFGVGYAGKFGVGTVKTNSVSVSAMASSTAPPVKASVEKEFLLWLFIAFVIALMIGSVLPNVISDIKWVALLLAPYMAYKKYRWNQEVWPQLYEQWTRSWICLKCGHRFMY